MPDSITSMAGIHVGGIFAPRLADRCEVLLNLLPTDFQQRADEMFGLMQSSDPRQSTHSGPADDPHQHGFSLVVERMSRGDLAYRALLNKSGKPLVPQLASSCFQAGFLCSGVGRCIPGAGGELKLKSGRQVFYK